MIIANLPMPLPRCPAHPDLTMRLRPLERQTKEQIWCGTWYDCTDPDCKCSVLFNSKELEEHLASFKTL